MPLDAIAVASQIRADVPRPNNDVVQTLAPDRSDRIRQSRSASEAGAIGLSRAYGSQSAQTTAP
jgi:hypothetical protein